MAKVDLNLVFKATERYRWIKLFQAEHAVWQVHLENFSAIDCKENFARAEDVSNSDSSAWLFEINVALASQTNSFFSTEVTYLRIASKSDRCVAPNILQHLEILLCKAYAKVTWLLAL